MITTLDLEQFTGTTRYYNYGHKFLLTDGVFYLAENTNSFWLLDAINAWQDSKIIQSSPMLLSMQFWTLHKQHGNSFILFCCEDDKIALTQTIEFSDFPLESITFYLQTEANKSVLMLPSEY